VETVAIHDQFVLPINTLELKKNLILNFSMYHFILFKTNQLQN